MDDGERGGTYWRLRVELPEPDAGAALHLIVFLETHTKPAGFSRWGPVLWVPYPTEAEADAARALVLADRPEVRCRVDASPPAAGG